MLLRRLSAVCALLTVCIFTLQAFAIAQQAATAPSVGVCVRPNEAAAILSRVAALRDEDYGAFRWLAFSQADYDRLLSDGLAVASSAVDYRLTLGDATFDPIDGPPIAPLNLTPDGSDGEGLRMVQFIGPTKSGWIDEIESAGLHVVQYIHPFTYILWGDAAAMNALADRPWVRWSGTFDPQFRMLTRYQGLTDAEIRARLLIVRHADPQAVRAALETIGATDISMTPVDEAFVAARVTVNGDGLSEIARIPGVYSVKTVPTDGGPRGEMSCLVNVNSVDGTNRAVGDYPTWLNGVGLSGAGVTVAVVDQGVLQTHPDLSGRMLPCEGTSCSDNDSPGGGSNSTHGTHCAAIVAGDGASGVTDSLGFLRGLGVAPGATLIEQAYSPYFFSLPDGMRELMRFSYSNGALLSNNSWGPAATPLGYDDDTRLVDVGVRDADAGTAGNQEFTFVLAILNGGGGITSVGTPDEGKNLITVGSTKMQDNFGAQILQIDDISSNSAHGPCLDGRRVPQIVAPGCNVDGAALSNSYSVFGQCGTSFAAPQIAGGAALFLEYYRLLPEYTADPSPALVKAAILAVARSLQGHDDADGQTLGPPFDSKQGYGRFDLEALVDPSHAVLYFDQDVVFDNTGESWSVSVMPENAAAPMRIMLAWTDAPGHGLGGATPAWNNNLNLVVEVGANEYRGNVIASGGFSMTGGVADVSNNTEAVFLGPASPAMATIRVDAANISSNGIPNVGDATDQDFALVCYNCVLVPEGCDMPGDFDGSNTVNGADIGGFVPCYIGGDPSGACSCADMDSSTTLESADIGAFVDCLLGVGCP